MGFEYMLFFLLFSPSAYMGYLTSSNTFQQKKKEVAYFFMPIHIPHSTAFLVSNSWKLWLNMSSYLFIEWLFCVGYHWLRNLKHKAT